MADVLWADGQICTLAILSLAAQILLDRIVESHDDRLLTPSASSLRDNV